MKCEWAGCKEEALYSVLLKDGRVVQICAVHEFYERDELLVEVLELQERLRK